MTTDITARIDQHTHVQEEKLIPRPPFPNAMKIEITSHCNYHCSFCAAKSPLRPKGNMDPAFLYRLLHEAKSAGVREVGMFLLGESFLVKDLPSYIRYAKEEAGIEYVFLTTNGSMCTPERVIPVIEAGLDSLKFSVNAGSAERYREIHGVDGFDVVIANIKWLHQYRLDQSVNMPRTCVSSIYNEEYRDELEHFREMISPFVDEFYFLPLYNQAGHVGGKRYTKIVGNPGRLANMVSPVPCWALFNAAKVTWDGWLTACCFDHDTRFKVADLNETTLLKAWHHSRFTELRRQHLADDLDQSPCAKCLGLID